MNTTTLQWRPSGNGHVQIADSTVTTSDGQPLTWYLSVNAEEKYWGLSLAPQGRSAVWHRRGVGAEDLAKDTAQEFEDANRGDAVQFVVFEVLERYHFAGGGHVDQVFSRTEALFCGEMNIHFARPAQKKLRKARRDDKVMRFFTTEGVAVVPARQVTHVQILQRRQGTDEMLRPEPGWPQHVHNRVAEQEAEAGDLVEQLLDVAMEYADKRVAAARPGAGVAEEKATAAALDHLRRHLTELVDDEIDD